MNTTHDIVAKLWNLCHVLRDDGITYHQYVTELTYLLFLKMAEETDTEATIPEGWRWADLKARDGTEQLTFYRSMLIDHAGSCLAKTSSAARPGPGRTSGALLRLVQQPQPGGSQKVMPYYG